MKVWVGFGARMEGGYFGESNWCELAVNVYPAEENADETAVFKLDLDLLISKVGVFNIDVPIPTNGTKRYAEWYSKHRSWYRAVCTALKRHAELEPPEQRRKVK